MHHFSTGRHQGQKFENSKNGTSSQNAKTGTTAKNTKDEKRENHENHRRHENRENAKTARSAKTAKTGKRQNRGEESIAHNCLLHFQALSASFCFSIFSCSRFSWFSPVFSCLCISSSWPRRANFLLRQCEPALISPPQQFTFQAISDRQQKDPEVAPLFNRELVEKNGLTDYIHIPNSVFPPWRHLHFFRRFKKCQISQAPLGNLETLV